MTFTSVIYSHYALIAHHYALIAQRVTVVTSLRHNLNTIGFALALE
jgi:hypothetical protein